MSDPNLAESQSGGSHEELMSQLFMHMVMQQSNMALMLMGKMPHPQTGETMHDLEAARLFIDQLEMLEAKTRGNLNKGEERMLKQSLMSLRMAFVESVEALEKSDSTAAPQTQAATPPEQNATPTPENPPVAGSTAAPVEESHKKFTKKY